MAISVDDSNDALLTLLWVREAWRLEPTGEDLPPLLVDTPEMVGESERAHAPITEWREAWPELWRQSVAHAGQAHDAAVFERLNSTANGSTERAALLQTLRGPHWQHRFGHAALDHGHREWRAGLYERQTRLRRGKPLAEPEHVSLDALIVAWKAGLTTIVQLPCRGEFSQPVRPHGLLVTEQARADPTSFRRALGLFAEA
jgi:hypothetical protein